MQNIIAFVEQKLAAAGQSLGVWPIPESAEQIAHRAGIQKACTEVLDFVKAEIAKAEAAAAAGASQVAQTVAADAVQELPNVEQAIVSSPIGEAVQELVKPATAAPVPATAAPVPEPAKAGTPNPA